MSAIAGIWNWDGQPVTTTEIDTLARHSRLAGPDAQATHVPRPGLALHAALLHFDQLATQERQPHMFGPGSVLLWDGRLDNRADLLLVLQRFLQDDQTDAALVAAAYQRWGLDSIRRLIGDWSFAIWDATAHELVLARDYMGNRPLFYLPRPQGLAFATRLDALAATFGLDEQPNETYIAGLLSNNADPRVTPYRGIHALGAGQWLRASPPLGVTMHRYWTFTPATVRHRNPADYIDQLRVLMTDGVRQRLRARRTVWAHLSGGFDSSSVVCLADRLIRLGEVEAPALQPLSTVYSCSPHADETPFIQAVERWCGRSTVRCEYEHYLPPFAALLGHRRPTPYLPEYEREASVHRAGDHVVLTGGLGDLIMLRTGSQAISILEPLYEGHPLRFLRLCLDRSRRRQRPLLTTLALLALSAYAPAKIQRALLRRQAPPHLSPTTRLSREQALAQRLTPDCLRHAPSPGEARGYPPVTEFPVVKRSLVEQLYFAGDHSTTSNDDQALGIWKTVPLTHRPLVEYVVAIPQLALWNPVLTRAGMKGIMADVLPPEVLGRTDKGEPASAMVRRARFWADDAANQAQLNTDGQTWALVRRGYVRPEALNQALHELFADQQPPSGFMRHAIFLEAWLRSLDAPRSVAPRAGHASEQSVSRFVSTPAHAGP